MRRSGNGTWARQYIYVLWNFPFIWITKIGITGWEKYRIKSIDRQAPGWDFYLFKTQVFGAYYLEQLLHAICFPFNIFYVFGVRFGRSGHTERFLAISILIALPIILLWWVLDKAFLLIPVAGLAYLAYFLQQLN